MNWIRENKFLTGFIAVVVLGAGVLGYLLYTAYSTYWDVTDQYNSQASELHRLQSLVPYPDQPNLAKYRAEEDNLKKSTFDLASSLSKMELPMEDMTPSAFQDRLRDTASAIVTKAGQTGVKLPDHFALDFDQYQIQPPPAAAAGPLGRQLEALNIATNILLDEHVDAIVSLSRTRLPQELGGAEAEHGGGGAGSGRHGGEAGLVNKVSFDVNFAASQPAFQKVLNDLAASSKQFFITRTLKIENSDPKPVSKTADVSAAAAAQPAPGSPDTSGTGGTNYLHFLVGTEKLLVSMRVDMVTFNPPEKAAAKGGGPAH